MEGSAAVAPAAADANGDVQAPDAAAVETPQVEPGQEQTDPNSPEARLKAAEDRAKAAEDRAAQLEGGQSEGPADLLAALEGEGDLGLSPEDLAAFQAGQEPGQVDAAQQDAQVQELQDWIKEQVQEQITPLQEARTAEQIQGWQDQHPDVKAGTPMFDEIVETMKSLQAEHGDGVARSIPMLNMVYTAAKAKLADAGATPAEAAASNGASIETQPGQSQTGESDAETEYKKNVYGGSSRDGAGFR